MGGPVGSVAGIILAAGSSRRMGRPKQLLPYGGSTLIERALATACHSRLGGVVVVTSPEVERALDLSGYPGLRILTNRAPERGQSASLRLGLRAAPEAVAGALVLVCDQPGLTPEAVERILRAFERERAGAIVPTYDGRWGTPVLLGRALWPEVMTLTGDIGARALLASRREVVRTVEVGDVADGRDVDTPDEYAALLEQHMMHDVL